MIKLRPYKIASKSAKLLARELGVKRIVNPFYRQKRRDLIVNWGNSKSFEITQTSRVLNKPYSVAKASNKLVALKMLKAAGVATPDFTEGRIEAARWLTEGSRVVARTILNGHSGNGAIVIEEGELPMAPLFTKYFRRDAEYRVHVFNGQVIDFVKKKRRNGHDSDPSFSPYIRTHQFGWVFCRDGIDLPAVVVAEALRAVAALSLDFGACDILYRNAHNGKPESCVVLEVNTAPGLEGTTLQKYVNAIRGLNASVHSR